MDDSVRLGIDFGGSGIKGALVDINKGELVSDRHRIPTPDPSTPGRVSEVIRQIVEYFNYKGIVGVAFPAAIQQGIVMTASNIDESWIGKNAGELFYQATGCRTMVLNDADAAGLAEIRFGNGQDISGVAMMVTVGSGLGTSIFINGTLLPNTELGHLYYKGKISEHWASDAVRKSEDLSWKKWGKRFGKYLRYLERLFYPSIIIIGGGASKKMERFEKQLKRVQTRVVPAALQNHAGIIGAAVEAKEE
jgi:polyphosphate glucokinase